MPGLLVIGLGNVLMGDDAFGPFVVQALDAGYALGPEVTARDLGTPGLDLVPYLMGTPALIVVDTVQAEGAPGELRLYRRAELLARPPAPRLNPHEPGLAETLVTLELLGGAPREVLLVGAIPECVRTGIGLSPALVAAAPRAVLAVLAELARLGHPAPPRERPLATAPWWLTPPEPLRAHA